MEKLKALNGSEVDELLNANTEHEILQIDRGFLIRMG